MLVQNIFSLYVWFILALHIHDHGMVPRAAAAANFPLFASSAAASFSHQSASASRRGCPDTPAS